MGFKLERRIEIMFDAAIITQTGVAANVLSFFSFANVRQVLFAFV